MKRNDIVRSSVKEKRWSTIRVQEIIIEDGKRYLLLDEKGIPVIPVMKYLKYLDSTEKSAILRRPTVMH